MPGAAEQWAGFVVTLGLIGIFYGALLALMQINIRRLLAFAVRFAPRAWPAAIVRRLQERRRR